jgi:hypothetical protein
MFGALPFGAGYFAQGPPGIVVNVPTPIRVRIALVQSLQPRREVQRLSPSLTVEGFE